jgi:hypothetical protein
MFILLYVYKFYSSNMVKSIGFFMSYGIRVRANEFSSFCGGGEDSTCTICGMNTHITYFKK